MNTTVNTTIIILVGLERETLSVAWITVFIVLLVVLTLSIGEVAGKNDAKNKGAGKTRPS